MTLVRAVQIYGILLSCFFSNSAFAVYCDSRADNSSYEWVESIAVNSTSYVSGNNNGYYLSPANIEIKQGQTIDLALVPGFRSSSYTEHWSVWIDYDQDQVFSATEQVFQGSSVAAINTTVAIPDNTNPGATRMRVSMKYGSASAECGNFKWGEVEDFNLNVLPKTPSPVVYEFELSLDRDYTVFRNGPLSEDLTWVVQKNGTTVLQRNAKHSLSTSYTVGASGENIHIWLERNQIRVSNIVEYTTGQTYLYDLSVATDYALQRSGKIGDALQWVVEKDNAIVLKRNAANELDYTYFSNTSGSYVRVWLEKFINNSYQRVSNYISYKVDAELSYILSVGQAHRVSRTGYLGEPIDWVVAQDGVLLERISASERHVFIERLRQLGSAYEVHLEKSGSPGVVLSNVVSYTVDDIAPTHTLSIREDGTVDRNGSVGESFYWKIEENGRIALTRYAGDFLYYRYPSYIEGSHYRVWLEKFISGGYQRVSNIVQYDASVQPPPAPGTKYKLSIDKDFTVFRNGELDVVLSWVVHKDGVLALKANAAYSLERRYWINTPGSKIEVWLEENDAIVSNVIEYVPGQTFSYNLSVDTAYGLTRSGLLGDNLQWVIEKNDSIALQRNAANELNYTYFSNTSDSKIRVWLQKFIGGSYVRVSNIVSYKPNAELVYEVSVDQAHRVVRTGYLGEPIDWVITEDGIELNRVPASGSHLYIEHQRKQGSIYRAWIEKSANPGVILSNAVTYAIDDITTSHNLMIRPDGTLDRSGALGERLTWVVEENGVIRLKRNAANELSYLHTLYSGSKYRFWLEKGIGKGYQRVSNIVQY